MEKKKKSIEKRTQKAVVTQDNRFIYAKYDMNTNEMKFFMWIVAQLNSQKEQLFQTCEIPLSEIFEIWQWKENVIDYSYCSQIVENMARKVYIEDFKLLDKTTMKEVRVKQAMPLFKFIRYQEGQSYITYELNDSLTKYLLNLDKSFTQLKFSDIQQMKSAYSIRIYNMLISELKQNRQNLKISLAVLQNILEVPKSLEIWDNFKQKILHQAKKDINAKSNIVLLDINTSKTGRKITDLEFIFDYKNNNKRMERDNKKQKSFYLALSNALNAYVGKSMHFKGCGELVFEYWKQNDKENCIEAFFRREKDNKYIRFIVKSFKSINSLQKAKDRAEELFYLDTERVQQRMELRKQLKSGELLNKMFKKI